MNYKYRELWKGKNWLKNNSENGRGRKVKAKERS